MTNKEKANAILSYVAQEIISPLAFDNRPAEIVWSEMTGEKFNKLCDFVRKTLDK